MRSELVPRESRSQPGEEKFQKEGKACTRLMGPGKIVKCAENGEGHVRRGAGCHPGRARGAM